MSAKTGIVKWFNNKAGYGFLTDLEDKKDVFVHHSALNTAEKHYNYLVEGEYVHYKVEETTEGEHKFQAANVTGINTGPLMCETRHRRSKERDDGWSEVKHKKRPTSEK